MGLLSSIFGENNPAAKWAGQNHGLLSQWGAGLAAGPTFGQGLANAAQLGPAGQLIDQQTAKDQQDTAEREAAITQSAKDLQKFPDLMQAVASKAITPQAAYGEMWKRMTPGYAGGGQADAPSSVREWEYFNALPDDATKAEYLRMKRANPYLDLGTGFAQPDPVNPGQTSGPMIAKDNFTPSYDSASGTAQGKVDVENRAAADSLASKIPGLKSVVSELGDLAKTATYTQTGQLWDNIVRETGNMPPEGAVARTKYMAMVDNQILPLLRDTFGAQFTVKEGESLRATLGAPDKSPVEKQAVLEAFIEQKVRDLEAMQSRIPSTGGAANYKSKYGLE